MTKNTLFERLPSLNAYNEIQYLDIIYFGDFQWSIDDKNKIKDLVNKFIDEPASFTKEVDTTLGKVTIYFTDHTTDQKKMRGKDIRGYFTEESNKFHNRFNADADADADINIETIIKEDHFPHKKGYYAMILMDKKVLIYFPDAIIFKEYKDGFNFFDSNNICIGKISKSTQNSIIISISKEKPIIA